MAGTRCLTIGEAWREERYEEIRMGGIDRGNKVKAHIKRIDSWMKAQEPELVLETMTRHKVKELQASLTRATFPVPAVGVPVGVDPEAFVTMREAVALPGMVSRSTLKRRIVAGRLRAVQAESAPHEYRVADLYADHVLGTPEAATGRDVVSQGVANDVVWVFDAVCAFAKDHHVEVPRDRASLAMHRTDRPAPAKRQPVSYAGCAEIAARLHAVRPRLGRPRPRVGRAARPGLHVRPVRGPGRTPLAHAGQ